MKFFLFKINRLLICGLQIFIYRKPHFVYFVTASVWILQTQFKAHSTFVAETSFQSTKKRD